MNLHLYDETMYRRADQMTWLVGFIDVDNRGFGD